MDTWRLKWASLYAVLAFSIAVTAPVRMYAGPISAIVEEIDVRAGTTAPMDLLVEGNVIELAESGRLVLGYLRSCLRETIVGGTVTIGAHKSIVVGGKRTAEQVTCDGGTIDSTARKSSTALGAVFREQGKRRKLPKPERTLFGISPIVRVSQLSKQLKILRLDVKNQQPIEIAAKPPHIDLAKQGIRLEPGGVYYFSDGIAGHVVKISLLARDNVTILSKFLPM